MSSFDGFDVIGISALYSNQIPTSLLLANALKKKHDPKIIIGGLGLGRTTNHEFFGLELMKSILRDTSMFNKENEISAAALETQIPDYTGLPLPFYRHRYFENQLALPYKVDSGCVYKCGFCIYRVVESFNAMDPAKAVSDLEMLKKKHGIAKFDIRTATINNDYEKLEEFCDLLIDSKLGIQWLSFASPSNLDKSILHKMKQSGCHMLKFGIESGSDAMLKILRKPFHRKKASDVLRMTKQQGIQIKAAFIGGTPHEREEDIGRTIEFIREHSDLIDFAEAHGLKILPHSEMHLHPKDYGITNLRPFNDSKYAFDEIDGLAWEDKKKQIEYSRSRLQRALYYHIFRKSNWYSLPLSRYLPFETYKLLERSVRLIHISNVMWDKVRMQKCTYVFN